MLEPVQISARHWIGFVTCILFFLALDLGVFHKRAHVVRFREAMLWTSLWFLLAMLFAATLVPKMGREHALEFVTGYIIELSLSMDNVFVIALIFAFFQVPAQYQHRVLFWGVLGALIMRGAMIGLGTALIIEFHWVLYFFGAFLVFSGIKMLLAKADERIDPEKNLMVRLARAAFPMTAEFDGQNFVSHRGGQLLFTPMVLVLVTVETTDLVFALDSIPAVFAVTQNPFVVFTSNVFAILGLRSLYFVLAGALKYFRYLKTGLSIVLVFIGAKMLAAIWIGNISAMWSLGVVGLILVGSVMLSLLAKWREDRRG
jgi:tellurite resistance protein TerC